MHGDATANPGQGGLRGRGDAWAAAEAYGCDMSLIQGSLRKTPRGLVQSWPEITRLAREDSKPPTQQAPPFEQE